jgi:hypothetical protein
LIPIESTGSDISWIIPPSINITNPRWANVTLYSGDPINLRFSVTVTPGTREISTAFGGKTIQSATSGNIFVVPIDTTWLAPGQYPIQISLIDSNLKSTQKSVTLNIINR